jgi:hypothetical protein
MLSAAILACLAVVGVFASVPEFIVFNDVDLPHNLPYCEVKKNCKKVDIDFGLIGKPSLDLHTYKFDLVTEEDIKGVVTYVYVVSNYIYIFFQCKAQYLFIFLEE